MTDGAAETEFYSRLKSKLLIQLKYMIGESDERDKLKPIEDYFYALIKPRIYWGSQGVEIEFDKGFETVCTAISQHISRDPKQMHTLEYLNTIEELKKQFKTSKN